MTGKQLFLLSVAFVVSACARPQYEIVEGHSAHSPQGQGSFECEASFKTSKLCVLWSWEKVPTASEAGTLVFKIVRENALDGSPVPVEVQGVAALVLWMPSMGHGSSPTLVEQVDTGSYRAKNVFFVMPGEWELRFQLKEGDVIQDEAVVTLNI